MEQSEVNAERIVQALRRFGFDVPALRPELFLSTDRIVRMGVEPMRIELFVSVDGVTFAECYARKQVAELHDLRVPFISLDDLKTNKRASGRNRDLGDLDELP